MNKEVAEVIKGLVSLVVALGLLALNVYVLFVAITALFATGHTIVAWLFIIMTIGNVVGKVITSGGKQ